MRPDIQASGVRASAIANRRRSLERYYENPNICINCSCVIEVKDNEKAWVARRKKFCSHACAGTYNNRQVPKRKPEGQCDGCGAQIKACLKYCGKGCREKAKSERAKLRTRKDPGLHVSDWRRKTKLRAIEYKGGACQHCGYNRCVNALDFHHIDPTLKEFAISSKIRSWEEMKRELDKCLLLCANCHRELHAKVWKIEDLIVVPPLVGSIIDF